MLLSGAQPPSASYAHEPGEGKFLRMKFAVVIPATPDAICYRRVDLLLKSLRAFEPQSGPIVIVVDGEPRDRFEQLLAENSFEGEAIANPRHGVGQGWLGRLTFGIWTGFQRAAMLAPQQPVLRIDTDALVIAPFAEELERLFAREPDIGLVGSSGLQSDGTVGGNWWFRRVYRMSKLISRWEHSPYYRVNLFGKNAKIRGLIKMAESHGYRHGESVCGGGYAVSQGLLSDLLMLPELKDEAVVANDELTEDVFFSLVARALGWKIAYQNDPGEVFGVCWKGLPGSDLSAVERRGNKIIHSIKDHPPFSEEATQRFFAEKMGLAWP